jgi:hypothetical protein
MQQFIVMVQPDLFLATIKNKKDLVLTPFLSQAAHLPFDFASQVCHTLQNRGHNHSLVCSYRGEPVTRRLLFTMMQQMQQTQEQEQQEATA